MASLGKSAPIQNGFGLRRWWPLALLLAVSIALRLFHLGSQPIWSDEGISWAASRLTPREMMTLSEYDHHAPLYYLLLKLTLAILPSTEAGLRALSVLLSAAAFLTILFFLAAEWGRSAAIYGGILTLFSSFDLYYSQEARMYTLLAAAWIISYIALVMALQGRPRWLIVWALACIALPWTHMYGFLVLGANGVFVLGYLVLKRMRRFDAPLDDRLLVAASAAVLLGILPMLRLLALHANTNSRGALLAQPSDLFDLYLLLTSGLVAVRQYFLDGSNLTLPAMEAIPPVTWFLAGTVICGAPAIYGLAGAWRMGGSPRLQVVFAIVNLLLPAIIAIGYSMTMNTRIWIQRPFLGAAYLLYLWAGIGVSLIRWKRARWTLAGLAIVVALASLVPYFTLWKKSDARDALMSMPAPDEHKSLVLEMRFLSSLARFYLGADAPMLALETGSSGMSSLVKPVFDSDHAFIEIMGRPIPVSCDDAAAATDFWFYGNQRLILKSLPQLPDCFNKKRLWLYADGMWNPINYVLDKTSDGPVWLQFDDIHDADWTSESYKPLDPGMAIMVTFDQANTGRKWLTVRYLDAPERDLEIWAAGQQIGRLGGGQGDGGWVEDIIELPATDDETMLVKIVNVGSQGAGVAGLAIGTGPDTPAREIERSLDLCLGTSIRLLGYDLAPETVDPGGALALTLYWQTDEPLAVRYKVFTHLLGETFNAATGNFIWGQVDSEPDSGQAPTSSWTPGEVIVDRYTIPLAADAPSGRYTLEIGLYGLDSGERLPVFSIDGQPLDDAIKLTTIPVQQVGSGE